MRTLFVASVSLITTDPARDTDLIVSQLGLPLRPPETVPGSAYRYSEEIEGTKHFGVWPLAEAAEACFGTTTWPPGLPVPQATIEFEVDDVDAAAAELKSAGHVLIHPARTEPWGQRLARFQSADGLLLAVCHTPHLHAERDTGTRTDTGRDVSAQRPTSTGPQPSVQRRTSTGPQPSVERRTSTGPQSSAQRPPAPGEASPKRPPAPRVTSAERDTSAEAENA